MPRNPTSESSSKGPRTSKFKPPRPSNPSLARRNTADDERTAQASSSSGESPAIPPDMLTRLLHEFFKDENTKISSDANTLVAKYMDTFVKEAIARAVIEKNENSDSSDKFLEVEDLEKLAPQLLLDF
ncbi:MAG: hypothetical protein M1816_001980 [Peltula sp. TS41687]|nr:MAG: hypothetical protein M1816_001980 [Peltula sp. TS41687]